MLNTDGAANTNLRHGGIRGVIRNANGEGIVGYAKSVIETTHTRAELLVLCYERDWPED